MSSTYSPSLRIQLIDTGTELEAWGQPLDNNLGTIIEQAITGVESISLTNLTSYTLTNANAVADQSRNAVLVFTGALSANCNVIAPAVNKVYVISNQTTGGKNISITIGSGANVAVANGTNQLVYCNGTAFKSAVDVNAIVGDLAVSGNSTVSGNVSVGTNIVLNNTISSSNGNLSLRSTTSNVVNFQGTTGALIPPYGTTSQRPATPQSGMSRWNSTLGWYEIWNGIIWQQITGSFSVSYLIVAGGGGGGAAQFGAGGGGGAGGALTGSYSVNPLSIYPITIGSGGIGWYFPGGSNVGTGTSGTDSTAFSLTAIGGGGGGVNGSGGFSGGSGGGMGGSGTSGQGYAGGNSGGGGAGQVGGNNYPTVGPHGGVGGNGIQSSITGTATYYAGGGAGSVGGTNPGYDPTAGGLGGGGYSASYGSGAGTNGLGGGGGGAGQNGPSQNFGSPGGSGIVILSYVNLTQRATGGTVTSYTSGGSTYWVHTFTTSGTFAT